MLTERDNEEFKGRFWTASFLPQYLISAILVGALTVIFESDACIFTVRFLENGGWVVLRNILSVLTNIGIYDLKFFNMQEPEVLIIICYSKFWLINKPLNHA